MKTFFNFFLTKAESGENKKILTKKRGETYLLKPEKLSKKRSKIKKNFTNIYKFYFTHPYQIWVTCSLKVLKFS